VTTATPDKTTGLPERDMSLPYILQTASGKILPILKEASVKLALGLPV
jgi:hypothetical protein